MSSCRALAALALLSSAVAACGQARGIGEACREDDDCAAGAMCTDRVCTATCTQDAACPFEQCCDAGRCVHPGAVGTCAEPAAATSTLTVVPESAIAGVEQVTLTVGLRDAHGRPMAGVETELVVTSGCKAFALAEPGCNTRAPERGVTDARGSFQSTLASRIAERKDIGVRISVDGADVVVPLTGSAVFVPGPPARVAFDVPGQVLLGAPLDEVSVALVDQFGNSLQEPVDDLGAPRVVPVVVQLEANPGHLRLVTRDGTFSEAGVPLSLGPPVALDGVFLPAAAHQIRVVATDSSGLLLGSVSEPFDVVAPSLVATSAGEAAIDEITEIDWTATPQVPVHRLSATSGDAISSPLPIVPFASSLALVSAHRTRLAAVPADGPLLMDVRVDATASLAFTGSGQVLVEAGLEAPGGDLILAGRSWGAVELGLKSGEPFTLTSTGGGYDVFVARIDPRTRELAWVVSASDPGHSVFGHLALGRDELVVSAALSGQGVWSDGTRTCTALSSGSGRDVSVARISLLGALRWCRALYGPGTEDLRGLVDVDGVTHVALVVSGDLTVETGPSLVPNSAARSFLAAFSTSGRYLPSRSFWSEAGFSSRALTVAPDGSLVLAGTALGSTRLSEADPVSAISAADRDAVVFGAREGRVSWVWHPSVAGSEVAQDVVVLPDGAVIAAGTFTSTFPAATGAVAATSPEDGFIAAITGQDMVRWVRHLYGSTTTPSIDLIGDGDRVLCTARASTGLSVAATPTGLRTDSGAAGGLVLDLDEGGRVRWSSPVLSPTTLSVSSAAGGAAWVMASGDLPMSIAPLEPIPFTKPNPLSGRFEGMIARLAPHNFAQLDVERVGVFGLGTHPIVDPSDVRPQAHVSLRDGTTCVVGNLGQGTTLLGDTEVSAADRDALVACYSRAGELVRWTKLRDQGSSAATDTILDVDVLASGDLIVALSTSETMTLTTDSGPKVLGAAGLPALIIARLRPTASSFAVAWATGATCSDATPRFLSAHVAALLDGAVLVGATTRCNLVYQDFAAASLDTRRWVHLARISGDGLLLERFDAFTGTGVLLNGLAAAPEGGATLAGEAAGPLTWKDDTTPFLSPVGAQAVVVRFNRNGAPVYSVASAGGAQRAVSVDHRGTNAVIAGVLVDSGTVPGNNAPPALGAAGVTTAYMVELDGTGGATVRGWLASAGELDGVAIASTPSDGLAFATSYVADVSVSAPASPEHVVGRVAGGAADLLVGHINALGALTFTRAGGSEGADATYSVSARADGALVLTARRAGGFVLDETSTANVGYLTAGRTITVGAPSDTRPQLVLLELLLPRAQR